VFPEEAKESGQHIGLTGTAVILENEPTDDGGGSLEDNWIPKSEPRARIDPLVTAKAQGLIADQIDEESTHIISLDATANVSTKSRIEINSKVWVVTGKRERTDPLIQRVEVKGA